jgi:Uma2 family endonuclease
MEVLNTTKNTEKKRRKAPSKVPDFLIYEVVDGKPVYYKGYKDVLNKTKTFEEITMDSTLQAWLKSRLTILLGGFLIENGYEITTGEQGLIMSNGDKRGADIAIFKAESLVVDEHYSRISPEIVIEIDISADLENTAEINYVLDKITDYQKFGVKNVVWIFTKSKKVMVAKIGQPWLTLEWAADIEIMGNLSVNLSKMMDKRPL